MGSIGVKKETKAAETAVKVVSQTEVDEKKRLANLKKKEKKKAKKVEEVKEEVQPVEQVLDEAAKKAALAEALKKR